MALYLIATPIGNLGDITIRALETLKTVDLILCEDTRHSLRLLSHYGIEKPLKSYHSYNEFRTAPKLIEQLVSGKNFALITDAGTPGISDPAFYLLRAALEAGIEVIPLPGASACITALTVSGLPMDRFCFEGFLPVKKGRKKRFTQLKDEQRTMVLYEAPHRIKDTLEEILIYLGDRRICLGRELTKSYEEFIRGKVSEVKDKIVVKGEFTIVIEGGEAYRKRLIK